MKPSILIKEKNCLIWVFKKYFFDSFVESKWQFCWIWFSQSGRMFNAISSNCESANTAMHRMHKQAFFTQIICRAINVRVSPKLCLPKFQLLKMQNLRWITRQKCCIMCKNSHRNFCCYSKLRQGSSVKWSTLSNLLAINSTRVTKINNI